MKLKEWVLQNYRTQVEFADALGVSKQQVSQWVRKGFIVTDGVLYSPRRRIDPPGDRE